MLGRQSESMVQSLKGIRRCRSIVDGKKGEQNRIERKRCELLLLLLGIHGLTVVAMVLFMYHVHGHGGTEEDPAGPREKSEVVVKDRTGKGKGGCRKESE